MSQKWNGRTPHVTGRIHAQAAGPDLDLGSVWSHYKRFWRYPGTVRSVAWYGGAILVGAVLALAVWL